MNKAICLSLLILTSSLQVQAEIYKWTDENGKVHYTDKKPAENAENVTKQVSKQNIDTSTEEMRKVENILRKENEADREYYQQQQQDGSEERRYRCTQAKSRLKEISGYVIFVDDDGKVVKVTEKERQQMVAEMNDIIRENCD